jgi:16S rRNA (cytosine1402-N4)-methyltransferase
MAHIPVLLSECIEALRIKEGGVYVDCTTNRGGHSKEIARHLNGKGTLICIDLDKEALSQAEKMLREEFPHITFHFVCSNFRHLASILQTLGYGHVDGVLADLGISSQELDESGRGFTFRYDEPLLMTFEDAPSEASVTAYDIVNTWEESSIADILFGYADERYSRRIASAIVKRRKDVDIKTTFQLLEIIESAVPFVYKKGKTHYATKTFQALRMAVNDELGSIEELISSLPEVLSSSSRAVFITFHSTEDRIVKHSLKSYKEVLHPVNKKAITPSIEEVRSNPRARSAQLRIVEK